MNHMDDRWCYSHVNDVEVGCVIRDTNDNAMAQSVRLWDPFQEWQDPSFAIGLHMLNQDADVHSVKHR